MMVPQRLSLAVICVLSVWTSVYAADCGDGQDFVDGRCCNMCPPGQYMKEFCSEKQTVCSHCKDGFFSDQYNLLDRCEECRTCQHVYDEKCNQTTNANCSCRAGFLCSNNVCSNCEENRCLRGEKLKRTERFSGVGLIKYSYQCEPQPARPNKTKSDVKQNIDKTHRDGIGSIQLILGIGFVLLSLTFLVFLSYACIKNLRKHKAPNINNNPVEVLPVSTNPCECHLSKEESGYELIVQDESNKSNSFGLLDLKEVDTC